MTKYNSAINDLTNNRWPESAEDRGLKGVAAQIAYWRNGTSVLRPDELADFNAWVVEQGLEEKPKTYATLGDIANAFRVMQADGASRASIEYALDRIYWEEDKPV